MYSYYENILQHENDIDSSVTHIYICKYTHLKHTYIYSCLYLYFFSRSLFWGVSTITWTVDLQILILIKKVDGDQQGIVWYFPDIIFMLRFVFHYLHARFNEIIYMFQINCTSPRLSSPFCALIYTYLGFIIISIFLF